MQSTLLKFNRFMSNFSTKLVGGFVPIIVYKYAPSNKMFLAILTCALQYLLSYVFDKILNKQLVKKSQLFLFLRLFPVALYEILLLFVDISPMLCAIGIGVGYSLSYVFKNIPTEVLFAYNNAKNTQGTGVKLSISKFIDQSAMILGTILGGYALDFWDLKMLIIISLVLYFIGSLPMLIYYFAHIKDSNLNEEYSTYAHIVLKERSIDKKNANLVSSKISNIYKKFYFFQESYNAIYILMPLLLFVITGKFTYSAYAGAIFDGVMGISTYLFGKLEHKKDITILSIIGGIMLGVMAVCLTLLNDNFIWLFYILVALIAIGYSASYIFMYNRMLVKSKIVGRNTTAIINKINMYFLSTFFVVSFGLFLPLQVCFYVAGGMSIVAGVASPRVEELTRRILVDHLEDNEIKEDYKIFSFKRKQ